MVVQSFKFEGKSFDAMLYEEVLCFFFVVQRELTSFKATFCVMHVEMKSVKQMVYFN